MYVNGLRKDMGMAMAAFDRTKTVAPPVLCAKCGCDDESMIETVREQRQCPTSNSRPPHAEHGGSAESGIGSSTRTYYCNICSHEWTVALRPVGRFGSIEDLVQRTGLRRDELTTLADIGALNAFTNERRSALWQVERAVRPAGELFADHDANELPTPDSRFSYDASERSRSFERPGQLEPCERSPLPPMNDDERLHADYAGMGLTIGPHPMALRREELALRGVLRASDLPLARDGRRVRVAGMVITRQRPGTAKGFVFLTLEDETGISNVIIRPDLFDRERMTVIRQPFLIVDGVLQHQEGVLSVRAERVEGMHGGAAVDAHDFY
jgi:error-prone DNA polymerase